MADGDGGGEGTLGDVDAEACAEGEFLEGAERRGFEGGGEKGQHR